MARPLPTLLPNVAVSTVTGIHSGKCSTRRADEVQRLLRTLTIENLYHKGRLCACGPKRYSQIVENGRNAIVVRLSSATNVPWDVNPRPAIASIIVQEGSSPMVGTQIPGLTTLWIGERSRHGDTYYSGIGVLRDYFHLRREECSV
jgi:hypothetical protein